MKARLSAADEAPQTRRAGALALTGTTVLCGVLFFVMNHSDFVRRYHSLSPVETSHISRDPSLPDRTLTPGSVQSVRLSDVCSAGRYKQARVVSAELRQRVLREYGLSNQDGADYEIDFLVIPELGGTEDIRNLWAEPYENTVWNARVKDELEERLHRLVCEQKVDLPEAQREIATNWISAYKKYFHTERPIVVSYDSRPEQPVS